MTAIVASAMMSCFGDGPATYRALLAGRCGVAPLTHLDGPHLNVPYGYQLDGQQEGTARLVAPWVRGCVAQVLARAVPAAPGSIPVIVGTGLGELRAAEQWATGGARLDPGQLHFAAALHTLSPAVGPVLTVDNACSASGHALALAADLVEQGLASQAVAAGGDTMTASMLAMIGRVTEQPTDRVRPFDAERRGVLLGEGAAAVLLAADEGRPALARLLGTGISCDAYHETAPAHEGIGRAMADALARADTAPAEVDVVLSHGTGTGLNDSTEAQALTDVLVRHGGDPLVTGVKGAIGHTSGASALMSLDVAVRCLQSGQVPPIVGLRRPLAEGVSLRLVLGGPVRCDPRVVQIDSFGFGGVNSVTLIGAPR